MTGRKLLIALVAAALYAVVLVTSASAEIHRVQVILVTGEVITTTVDVPPGASVSSVQIPGLPAPAQSVVDLGPVGTPTPTATVPPAPTVPAVPEVKAPELPTKPGGSGGGATGGSGGGSAGGGGGGTSSSRYGDESPVNRATGNVRSGAGRVVGKVRRTPGDAVERSVRADGSPSPSNPTFSLATPGAARIGVPNFFIDKFRVPPFLLPIYQAAGIQYGVRWEILAAINEIETDYGRNLNVSSAGALGWMQFMPATWRVYGVDANGDGKADPYNPVDAIFAAARYLRAAGADTDIRQAVFAYNHATWYVDSVLLRAQVIGGMPANLVGSLTGLTQGRFPVLAKATYAGQLKRRGKRVREGNAAMVVEPTDRHEIEIFTRPRSRVVAVNDGRVLRVGSNRRLGNYVVLQDVYGNTYTYGHLGSVARRYPSPKPRSVTEAEVKKELALPEPDAAPAQAASSTDRPAAKAPKRKLARRAAPKGREKPPEATKERLFANPTRPNAAEAGGAQQEFQRTGMIDGWQTFEGYFSRILGLDRKDVKLKRLRKGSRVVAGTVLGRIGPRTANGAPHLRFKIRPAGRGAPTIDPKPILDGWKLLESTAIYRAAGKNPFFGRDAANPSIGQILLMSKEALVARVLANPQIDVYECGRRDIRAGGIDRRILATLEFLAASGLRPTVSSLHCGHGYFTKSGNVSHHSSGNAVDIAAINGITISPATQGPGSITELTIQRLLTLQGTMEPAQIISLMKFDGATNTYAMGDHDDHIHVGFQPLYATDSKMAKQVNAILKPKQWIKLIDRLGEIQNPKVSRTPSKYALKVTRSASASHEGE